MSRWLSAIRAQSPASSSEPVGSGFDDVWRTEASLEGPGDIEIGPHTYWSPTARFVTWGPGASITIGAYCSIAWGVQVLSGGDHGVSRLSTYAFSLLDSPPSPEREPLRAETVEIGNDVWIGTNAILVGPLKVGDGAVIGAGAVVVSDVGPYALVGGVPARTIRTRLPDDAIELMEKLKWWEWSVDVVREAEPLLRGEDWTALREFAARKGLFDSEAER